MCVWCCWYDTIWWCEVWAVKRALSNTCTYIMCVHVYTYMCTHMHKGWNMVWPTDMGICSPVNAQQRWNNNNNTLFKRNNLFKEQQLIPSQSLICLLHSIVCSCTRFCIQLEIHCFLNVRWFGIRLAFLGISCCSRVAWKSNALLGTPLVRFRRRMRRLDKVWKLRLPTGSSLDLGQLCTSSSLCWKLNMIKFRMILHCQLGLPDDQWDNSWI